MAATNFAAEIFSPLPTARKAVELATVTAPDAARNEAAAVTPELLSLYGPPRVLSGVVIQSGWEQKTSSTFSKQVSDGFAFLVKKADQWLNERHLPALAIRTSLATGAASAAVLGGLVSGLEMGVGSFATVVLGVGAVGAGIGFIVGFREMLIRRDFQEARAKAGITELYGAKF